MKKLLLLLVFTIILTYSYSQASSDSQPEIFFEDKTIHFGSISEGEVAIIVFKFYNSGSAPLLLKSVKASCGCTASKWPQHPIMPGKSSTIEAKFNSKGFGGNIVNKSITVTTNAPNKNGKDKVVILNFKGSVKAGHINKGH